MEHLRLTAKSKFLVRMDTWVGGHSHLLTTFRWESITSYTPCAEPVQIKTGDSLTMDAHYDLTKHKLRPRSGNTGEAEGMALATFVYALPHTE
jgi:hypothetical protein